MPQAVKGSQAALQRLVEQSPELLQPRQLSKLEWVSPRREDDWSEYRDGAALDKLGLARHAEALTEFWPRGGPVWDGLAKTGDKVVLVEAKSHIREFLSPPSAATAPPSIAQIETALRTVKSDLGADDRSNWARVFFQYANRLAFLWWLRGRGVDAYCLFVSFLGDLEMGGPDHAESWQAAFLAADHALGLPARHALTPCILHVHPRLNHLENP